MLLRLRLCLIILQRYKTSGYNVVSCYATFKHLLQSKPTYRYSVIIKDDLWCLDIVLLSSLSHYGVGLFNSPLTEQPPWRLRDEPALVFNTETFRLRGLKYIKDGVYKKETNYNPLRRANLF